jgi:hypothetical protein
MGWRGTLRAIEAANRAAGRDALRRARAQAKEYAALQKVVQREQAAAFVQKHEEFVASLVSTHRTCSQTIDWTSRASEPPPTAPQRPTRREDTARRTMESFRPSLWSRLFGRVEGQWKQLEEALSKAISDDEEVYQRELKEHAGALEAHRDGKELAEQVLAGNIEAMKEYLQAIDSFQSIGTLGESLRLSVPDSQCVVATLDVHSQEVVPKEIPKLLASGKISMKALNQGDYQRLYQDHVCSSLLRVAAETFAALPVQWVVATAVDDLLDSSTGHLVSTPILSIAIPRQTLSGLNLANADPSDTLRHFRHQMAFKPTSGFARILPIEPNSIQR